MSQKPDRSRCNVRVWIPEQIGNRWNGFFALSFQPDEAAVTDVHRWALERGDLTGSGCELKLWNLRFEALWRDPINRSCRAVITGAVSSHLRIVPISDVDSAVRTDADVAWAEPVFESRHSGPCQEV